MQNNAVLHTNGIDLSSLFLDSHSTTAKCHIIAESGERSNNGTALEHEVIDLLQGRGRISNRFRCGNFRCFFCSNSSFSAMGLVAA